MTYYDGTQVFIHFLMSFTPGPLHERGGGGPLLRPDRHPGVRHPRRHGEPNSSEPQPRVLLMSPLAPGAAVVEGGGGGRGHGQHLLPRQRQRGHPGHRDLQAPESPRASLPCQTRAFL